MSQLCLPGETPPVDNDLLPLRYYAPGSVTTNLAMAEMAYKSGLLPSYIRSPQAALYVMQRGLALGLDPFFALENTHHFNGKIMLGIGAAMAILARAGVKWKVVSNTPERAECVLMRPDWEPLTSVFTAADATKAGLGGKDSYRNHPADILWANAFRKGARKIASDILAGMSFLDDYEIELTPQRQRTVLDGGQDQLPLAADEPPPQEPKPARKTRVKSEKVIEAAVEQPVEDGASSDRLLVDKIDRLIADEVDAVAQAVQDVTCDNAGYQKCDSDHDQLCFDYNNVDHRTLLSQAATALGIPSEWRIKNKDRLIQAMGVILATPEAIEASLKSLWEVWK